MANPVENLRRVAEEYRVKDAKDKKRYWVDLVLNNALYILMAIFVIYTATQKSNFLTPGSFANLIIQVAAYLPMALGIAGCIVLTGTDLSAGRVSGLTAAIAGVMLQKTDFVNKMFDNLPEVTPVWIAVALLAVVAVGALIGLVNGFFVAKFSLHPFIVTLSTQLITYGIILWFFALNGNNGQPISGLSEEYKTFVTGEMFRVDNVAVPRYVAYAVILVIVMWFIWNKTTFGKNMFAVGSNAEAARVSGVNVFWTTVLVHTLAGAMYGYTGFIEGARSGSVAAGSGLNAECDAIAACVIGGVSFVGGTGKISGIILGVFVLRIIFVALTMLGVDSSSLYIIKGAIILCACALDMRKYLVKK
ncbi:MAG: beta-methylgalactoside transporter [Oscillospiraceae bacterium]|nr:beta-methylgalactoside transporter [Oscillospiraceae bacterium]